MNEDHDDLLSQAFSVFTRLERTLRRKIGAVLSVHFGLTWVEQLPTTIYDACKAKMENAKSEPGPEREQNILEFTDFSELVSLLNYFWEPIFYTWFEDKKFTKNQFEEIRAYRNPLMHSNLRPNQCPYFINLCQVMLNKLNMIAISSNLSIISEKETSSISVSVEQRSRPSTEQQRRFYQKIMSILNQMSGLFEGEREALLNHIDQHLIFCTYALLEEIRHKFDTLTDTDQKIEKLIKQLPPQLPQLPQPNWKLKKWLQWIVNEYLPYRYWMIINDQRDMEIEAMSKIYEGWLYKNYPKLIQNPQRFVWGTHEYICKELEKKTVLWILIDTFPFFLKDILVKQLNEQGFEVQSTVRQLSLLPSEANLSRQVTLTGYSPNQMPSQVTEKEMVLQAWQNYTDKNICWLDELQDLETVKQKRGDLFIYVYNRLNELLRKPATKDFERDIEIEAALTRLVSKLQITMRQLAQIGESVLIISSNCGSTYLPKESSIIEPPDTVSTEHMSTRSISVFNQMNIDDINWFYLDKDEFNLPYAHLIVQGWQHIQQIHTGFVSGGLSPEETLVPMFICELNKKTYKRLYLTYEQATEPLRLGRPGPLAIRIQNPYPFPIEMVEVTLSDDGSTFPKINIAPHEEEITMLTEWTLSSNKRPKEGIVFESINIIFRARGEQFTQKSNIRLAVQQLYTNTLDDDFGAMFS